jgi:hypothetical protein
MTLWVQLNCRRQFREADLIQISPQLCGGPGPRTGWEAPAAWLPSGREWLDGAPLPISSQDVPEFRHPPRKVNHPEPDRLTMGDYTREFCGESRTA